MRDGLEEDDFNKIDSLTSKSHSRRQAGSYLGRNNIDMHSVSPRSAGSKRATVRSNPAGIVNIETDNESTTNRRRAPKSANKNTFQASYMSKRSLKSTTSAAKMKIDHSQSKRKFTSSHMAKS
jgi:hypothetical protein